MVAPTDDAPLDLRLCSAGVDEQCALVVDAVPYTFRALSQLIDQALASWPVHPEQPRAPVALRAVPTLRGLVHFYAALALDAPCLLIHPRFSPRQVADLIDTAGARAYFDGETWTATTAAQVEGVHPQAALLLATSGTTGQYKLVQHSHATLRAAARMSACNLPFADSDRWLLSLPYAHVGGVSVLVRCLLARKPVVVAHGSFADPAFIQAVEQQGCSLYSLVPTQLHDLLSYCQRWGTRPKGLRHVLVGGAPATLRLRRLAHEHGLRALFTYGMTEAGSQITTQRPDATLAEPQALDAGYALDGVDLRLDEKRRLWVRSPSLMLGYLGDPALRSSATAEPPWFMTNDRAIIHPDGRVQILGRTDHLLITGGENVDPEWVEQILGEHPWVQEVAVCGLPDPRWGERLVALVVPSADAPMDRLTSDLQSFGRQHLPPFALFKELRVVARLPRLGIGKLDRTAALAMAQALESR